MDMIISIVILVLLCFIFYREIKSDKEVQIQRLIKRDNINEEYALKKIHSQLPIEEKEKYANFIIDNSLSIENTYNQVDQILKLLEEQ